MKTLLCLLTLAFVSSSNCQEAEVTEQYMGVIYAHGIIANGGETMKEISPRLGVNMRFPFLGSLHTRVVYDVPDRPFGHIMWELPIQESGWSGVRLHSGYQPRLAALIKPSPLTVDGHNETCAMASAPGAAYSLRLSMSDSVGIDFKTRYLIGTYRDEARRFGCEAAMQLFVGPVKAGLTGFFDSQGMGSALFIDSEFGNLFLMGRLDKHWEDEAAGSCQIYDTIVGDPYLDVVWDPELNEFASIEAGSFMEYGLPYGHHSQLGAAYEFTNKIVKLYVILYW